MALLDDIRASLRISSAKFDAEAQMLVDAAVYDMERTGVNPALLQVDPETGDFGNAFVKHAVTTYCKAHFGYDVDEAMRFDDSYRRIVCDLLNSAENIAAIEQAARDGGEEDDPAADDPATDGEGGGE